MRLSILVTILCSILGHGYATFAPSAYLWTVDTGSVKQESNQVTSASPSLGYAVAARRRGTLGNPASLKLDAAELADVHKLGGYQFQAKSDTSAQSEPVKIFISIANFEGSMCSRLACYNSLH